MNVEHCGGECEVAIHRRHSAVALSSPVSVAVLSNSICWYFSTMVSLLDLLNEGDGMGQDNRCMWSPFCGSSMACDMSDQLSQPH